MNLPLSGVRVLCAARYLPAGYCTMLLADAGADVILVEQSQGNIDERVNNPTTFNAVNRGKRSLTINLKSEKGQSICHALVKKSDVFIDGFRPGVSGRLKLDYETLKKINPNLVYISISGFGQNGPYRLKAAHDLTYQGMVGMLAALYSQKGNTFYPALTGLGDLIAGMFAAVAILTDLVGVKQGNQGRYIDLSMTDCLLSWMNALMKEPGKLKAVIQDYGYDIYPTSDNKFISLSMVNEDHFWRNLCTAINRNDLSGLSIQERANRTDELAGILKSVFIKKTRDEWVEILTRADVPSGPVYTEPNEVFEDPQLRARNMLYEMDDPKTGKTTIIESPLGYVIDPAQKNRRLPGLGEHNDEILSEILGFGKDEIVELKKAQII
jgi:crotonobetainyl-CoA:carnitine CoA-transferase CaiB-like acyl-CoA transferase